MGAMECEAPGCNRCCCTNSVETGSRSYYICDDCIPKLVAYLTETDISDDSIDRFFDDDSSQKSDRVDEAIQFLKERTSVYTGSGWETPGGC